MLWDGDGILQSIKILQIVRNGEWGESYDNCLNSSKTMKQFEDVKLFHGNKNTWKEDWLIFNLAEQVTHLENIHWESNEDSLDDCFIKNLRMLILYDSHRLSGHVIYLSTDQVSVTAVIFSCLINDSVSAVRRQFSPVKTLFPLIKPSIVVPNGHFRSWRPNYYQADIM